MRTRDVRLNISVLFSVTLGLYDVNILAANTFCSDVHHDTVFALAPEICQVYI